jgi:tetratricopeptide (TPR) repeat protein
MYSGNYARAEESFAAVARVLPLPEVVNNEAVAMSRRGHDGIALFRQALATDATDADYHFNLAVSLYRHGDKAEALTEMGQSLKIRPNDAEAKSLEEAWKAAGDTKSSTDALERIKRSYNGAAFRQAALMLEQVDAARLQALTPAERASKLSHTAHEKLDRGLLLEAEREYQAALTADDHSAEAHAGLAEVRERAGDQDAARKEAHAALDRGANLEAYLVLARLDLAANHWTEARDETAQALRLDANSRTAKDLHRTIEAHLDGATTPGSTTPGSTTPGPAKPE